MYYLIFLNTFIVSSFFCFVYDLNFPQKRYLATEKNKVLDDYKKILPLSGFNLILSKFFFDYIENNFFSKDDLLLNYEKFFIINFFKLIFWLIISDILFYFFHKIFHYSLLYKHFHSLHHKYIYTYGLAALYAHPIDYIFTNLFPLLIPIIILQINKYLVYIMIFFSTSYTVIVSHGGYIELPHTHLLHHKKKTVNYGLFVTDKIFNTNSN